MALNRVFTLPTNPPPVKKATHMLCPIEGSEKGGVTEVRDWECCVKRVQANERDKRGCGCIQCAGGVSVSEATG